MTAINGTTTVEAGRCQHDPRWIVDGACRAIIDKRNYPAKSSECGHRYQLSPRICQRGVKVASGAEYKCRKCGVTSEFRSGFTNDMLCGYCNVTDHPPAQSATRQPPAETCSTRLRISGSNARMIIKNCHALMRHKYKGMSLWSMVGDITGHGSSYSIEICRTANLDPHQPCAANKLLDLKEQQNG